MYRIEKEFAFSAAHHLNGLPLDHPCSRHHGHNYVVKLVLESNRLSDVGFVRDYRELDKFKQWLEQLFDHRDISDILAQPTAENMARFIYEYAATNWYEVAAVGVSETPKTWAWWTPEHLPAHDTVLGVLREVSEEPTTSADRQQLKDDLTAILK